jgi:hypothetical protein
MTQALGEFSRWRFPDGTDGQLLALDLSLTRGLKWLSVYGVLTKTSDYTMAVADRTILVDASGGAVTITLPNAYLARGLRYYIKRISGGANVVTIQGAP